MMQFTQNKNQICYCENGHNWATKNQQARINDVIDVNRACIHAEIKRIQLITTKNTSNVDKIYNKMMGRKCEESNFLRKAFFFFYYFQQITGGTSQIFT